MGRQLSMRGMRVAFLSLHSCPLGRLGTHDTGGMSIYVAQVAKRLAKKGILVDIFTAHSSPEWPGVGNLSEGVRLVHVPLESYIPDGKLGLFPHLADVACSIHNFGKNDGVEYQLVHSHYWLSGLAGQILAGWWKVPHVTMMHTSALGKNRALGTADETELRAESERRVLSSVDRIVATTRREVRDLVELYDAHSDRIVVISCGVDLKLFRPRPMLQARESLGLPAKQIILWVGRLEPEKGLDLLLDAIASLDARDGVLAVIVGGGAADQKERERIALRCRRLGIERQVVLRDAVPHDCLPQYYAAADVFVFPSCYETFGLVALEALACGTPVVATRVGVVAELPGTDSVVLLERRTSDALAAALQSVLDDAGRLKAMREGARRAVRTMEWDSVAARITTEYEKLLRALPHTREAVPIPGAMS